MNQPRFYKLSDITGRIQKILQPHIGKLFWVKAEISSGRERGSPFIVTWLKPMIKAKSLHRCDAPSGRETLPESGNDSKTMISTWLWMMRHQLGLWPLC